MSHVRAGDRVEDLARPGYVGTALKTFTYHGPSHDVTSTVVRWDAEHDKPPTLWPMSGLRKHDV